MKINKKAIDKLLLLNDEQLWSVIQIAASKSGVKEFKELTKPNNMEKVRDTLKSLDEYDIDKVSALLKRGLSNG